MCTYRAFIRSISTDDDMSAVSAFPNLDFAFFENFLSFHVFKKCTVSFLVVLLYGSDTPEPCGCGRRREL